MKSIRDQLFASVACIADAVTQGTKLFDPSFEELAFELSEHSPTRSIRDGVRATMFAGAGREQ